MYFTSGIFIWWPHDNHPTVPWYTIQFWHNDTNNPTIFSDEAIGTTVALSDYAASEDVEMHFVKISAITNVHPYSQTTMAMNGDKANSIAGHGLNETITEVRVAGNVTGILIPNTQRIVARVLIPIMYNGEPIYQDTRYVQWRAVCDTNFSLLHMNIFVIYQ